MRKPIISHPYSDQRNANGFKEFYINVGIKQSGLYTRMVTVMIDHSTFDIFSYMVNVRIIISRMQSVIYNKIGRKKYSIIDQKLVQSQVSFNLFLEISKFAHFLLRI